MHKKFRVAVVDDDALSRALLSKVLQADFDVLAFDSGESFLSEIPAVDLLLLDIEMNGMNGYEVCRCYRMHEEYELVPVVFVSGHDQPEQRLAAFEAGGDDFIIKPIVANEVRHKVATLVGQEENIRRLKAESDQARQMAFNAMTSMGDLGVILEFMRGSANATEYRVLAERLVTALQSWGLKGAIQIRGDSGRYERGTESEQYPLQNSVMETLKDMGRVFQMGSRGIINFPHISILIHNLPVDQPEKVGQLRDLLAMLAESADARIEGIDMNLRADQMRGAARMTLDDLRSVLTRLSSRLRHNQGAVSVHMQDLMDDMFRSLQAMNITAVQEAMITDLMTAGTQDLLHLFDETANLEAEFMKVLASLEALGK